MSRRKQSRPQSFKQFLEERKSPNKVDDESESTSSNEAKDEEEADYHGNNMESTIPEEFVIGTDGITAATLITTNKVFGPYHGTIIKADPESDKDDEGKTSCQQIMDSDGALYTISIGDTETGCDQHWLMQVSCQMEDANIGIHSQDGKLYLRTLEDIPQGCLLKAIYVKEDIQRGVKRQRSNGTYMEHEEETHEVNNKKMYTDTPKSPKPLETNTIQNPVTSSETVVTSSLSVMTSSPPLVIKTEAMDSDTIHNNEKEGITETSTSVESVGEAETASVAKITHESIDKGPPYNCQHCCIEFRNPDNLEAHRTYYCPTTATQPLPASMRRVPPGANTVIKRRNRTPKQTKPVPYQARSSTPPSTSTAEEKTPGTYVCQLCQSSFTNHTNCESHMLLLHCDETVNLCKFCNFIAPSLAKLKVHVFTHVQYYVSSSSNSPNLNRIGQGSPSREYVQQTSALTVRADENTNVTRIKLSESEESKTDNKINKDEFSARQANADDSTPVKTEAPKSQEVPSSSISRSPSPVVDTDGRHQSTPVGPECMSDHPFSCSHCKFETSEKHIYAAHMNQHRLPVLKIPSTKVTSGSLPKLTRVVSPIQEQVEAANKCHECNIVFMSRQNFVAHKQFYCAGRHSQMSPDLPETNVVHAAPMTTTGPSEDQNESEPHIDSQTPTSPKSGRSSSSSNSNLAAISAKMDEQNALPHTNSSSSSHSTPSPLPTMVQLHGPRPPMSSQSSSPALTSPPPYIIPTGSVLSGVTHQGAPVLLVAVPFPAAAGVRGDVPSLQVSTAAPCAHAEEEKPLDLSVKTSRSSPEVSTSRVADTSPRSIDEERHQAAVIDLSRMTQSNLRSPPPPQVEQLNECKKCDIVFNKYESLLAHKQYYCASRHLRGRQIEMSYRQNVVCSTSSVPMDNAGEMESKTQSESETPTSSNQIEVADSDRKGCSDTVDTDSVIIKQEQEETLGKNVSILNSGTSSEKRTNENNTVLNRETGVGSEDDEVDQENEFKENTETNLPGLTVKPAAKQSVDDRETMMSAESSRVHISDENKQTLDKQQSSSKDTMNLKDTSLPQSPKADVAGRQVASLDLPKLIPRPFSCQACTVSFMKFESLDVHQKFYCAARNVNNSPQPIVNVPKVLPVATIPVMDKDNNVNNEGTKSFTQSREGTPQRDSLFCKGCGQYFATSKQVRRHSCKNGANFSSLAAQKRSSPDQNVTNNNRLCDITGPPIKRCKHESVLTECQELGHETTNGVVIKQEYVDRSYSAMSSRANNEPLIEEKCDEKQDSNQHAKDELVRRIKHEDESVMSSSCHNGNGLNTKENNAGLTPCNVSNKELHSQSVKVKEEKDTNSSTCPDNGEQLSSEHKTKISGVIVTACSDSLATQSITTVSDTRSKTSGHFRVTSGANLSGRSRVIQQPPAKHCSTCNIDFNSLSNFIAHKKYYCSARQQAKS